MLRRFKDGVSSAALFDESPILSSVSLEFEFKRSSPVTSSKPLSISSSYIKTLKEDNENKSVQNEIILLCSYFEVNNVYEPLPHHNHPLHPFLVGQVLLF